MVLFFPYFGFIINSPVSNVLLDSPFYLVFVLLGRKNWPRERLKEIDSRDRFWHTRAFNTKWVWKCTAKSKKNREKFGETSITDLGDQSQSSSDCEVSAKDFPKTGKNYTLSYDLIKFYLKSSRLVHATV